MKAKALKKVFLKNNHLRWQGQGIAAFNFNLLTAYLNRPLLFADIDFKNSYMENNQLPSHSCKVKK